MRISYLLHNLIHDNRPYNEKKIDIYRAGKTNRRLIDRANEVKLICMQYLSYCNQKLNGIKFINMLLLHIKKIFPSMKSQ